MSPGGGRRGSGKSAVAAETELKLRFPPAHLRRVLSGFARGSITGKMTATYYDTPALDLWRQGLALRVRREGRRWVQAVKGAGSAASGVHQRLEIETVLGDRHPDLSGLPRHPVTKVLGSRKLAAALIPVVQTAITRSRCLLEPVSGVQIELAVDRGLIRSGRRSERVCEIELELKSGPVSALFDLARQIAAVTPLALEHRSKAERGYALFPGSAMAPARAKPVALDRSMTAGAAFRMIATAALAQVHANEHGVISSDDPEYLHQMRVGLRRLRSAFSLFRGWLGDTAASQIATLRTVTAGLGPARDWDVLVTELLPALRPALTAQHAATAFEQLCQGRRQAARAKAKKSLKTNTYNKGMLMLGSWLAAHGSGGDRARWRQPVRACAARILAERHARVLQRGRRLARRTPAELHRLRIAVKQLRYAVEFFSALFPARGMATLRRRAAALQDILGRINDVTVVSRLAGAAARASDDSRLAAAAGTVIGWCEARAGTERAALPDAWRSFRAARRPWRE